MAIDWALLPVKPLEVLRREKFIPWPHIAVWTSKRIMPAVINRFRNKN